MRLRRLLRAQRRANLYLTVCEASNRPALAAMELPGDWGASPHHPLTPSPPPSPPGAAGQAARRSLVVRAEEAAAPAAPAAKPVVGPKRGSTVRAAARRSLCFQHGSAASLSAAGFPPWVPGLFKAANQ